MPLASVSNLFVFFAKVSLRICSAVMLCILTDVVMGSGPLLTKLTEMGKRSGFPLLLLSDTFALNLLLLQCMARRAEVGVSVRDY